MSKEKQVSDKDKALWDIATRDVKTLSRKKHPAPETAPGKPPETPVKGRNASIGSTMAESPVRKQRSSGQAGALDSKTGAQLRKGDIRIDGRLDLHGHSADSARKKLLKYIQSSRAAGRRCVLVITGKGSPEKPDPWYESMKGVIRREFRLWLEDASVAPYIRAVSEAHPKHGGTGAFYIYLRKDR